MILRELQAGGAFSGASWDVEAKPSTNLESPRISQAGRWEGTSVSEMRAAVQY
jgi:hypothetical protein